MKTCLLCWLRLFYLHIDLLILRYGPSLKILEEFNFNPFMTDDTLLGGLKFEILAEPFLHNFLVFLKRAIQNYYEIEKEYES